jgi:hypothetical protein
MCILAAGSAVAGNFLPKEIQQYVEDVTKVCYLPPGCPQLPEAAFTKELDLPDSSAKVMIEFIELGHPELECLKGLSHVCCASGIYRVSLLKKKTNATAQGRADPEIEKSVSVLTQLGPGTGPDAVVARAGKMPVLLLKAWTGGNCGDCSMSIVISLDPRRMLALVGKALPDEVPDWTDLSGGEINLSVVYEGLENGFGLVGLDAPSPPIYLRIDKGRLVPDRSKCFAEWEPMSSLSFGALDEGSTPDEMKSEICHRFGMLLEKLLIEHFMGKGDAAWKHFRSGLKLLLDANGKLMLDTCVKKEGYSPEEIEAQIRKQMGIRDTES